MFEVVVTVVVLVCDVVVLVVVNVSDVVEVAVVVVLVDTVVVVGLLQSMEAKSAVSLPEPFGSHAVVARAGKQAPFSLL